MAKKEVVGKWIDEMNECQSEKRKDIKKEGIVEKILVNFLLVKKMIQKNWFIFTVSTLIAIPLLIISVYIINFIGNSIHDYEEIRGILGLSGVMLVIPFVCLYVYFIHLLSVKKMPIVKAVLFLSIIIMLMLNITAGLDVIKLIEANEEVKGNFIFTVFFIDVYMVSFMITKLSYLFFKKIIGKIKKVADWVVNNNQENDDILKAKLSFINKIITGFLAIVASILGLLLTLNQILN